MRAIETAVGAPDLVRAEGRMALTGPLGVWIGREVVCSQALTWPCCSVNRRRRIVSRFHSSRP